MADPKPSSPEGASVLDISQPNADEDSDVYQRLAQKERDLVLAAELGKALLDSNQELQSQYDHAVEEYSLKIEGLQQENHSLHLELEKISREYQNTIKDLQDDISSLKKELKDGAEQQSVKKESSRFLREAQHNIDYLMEQIKKATAKEDELIAQLQEEKKKNQSNSATMQDQVDHITMLREQVEYLNEKLRETSEKLREVEAERDNMCYALESSQETVQVAQANAAQLKEKLLRHENELEEAQEANCELQQRVSLLQASQHQQQRRHHSYSGHISANAGSQQPRSLFMELSSPRGRKEHRSRIPRISSHAAGRKDYKPSITETKARLSLELSGTGKVNDNGQEPMSEEDSNKPYSFSREKSNVVDANQLSPLVGDVLSLSDDHFQCDMLPEEAKQPLQEVEQSLFAELCTSLGSRKRQHEDSAESDEDCPKQGRDHNRDFATSYYDTRNLALTALDPRDLSLISSDSDECQADLSCDEDCPLEASVPTSVFTASLPVNISISKISDSLDNNSSSATATTSVCSSFSPRTVGLEHLPPLSSSSPQAARPLLSANYCRKNDDGLPSGMALTSWEISSGQEKRQSPPAACQSLFAELQTPSKDQEDLNVEPDSGNGFSSTNDYTDKDTNSSSDKTNSGEWNPIAALSADMVEEDEFECDDDDFLVGNMEGTTLSISSGGHSMMYYSANIYSDPSNRESQFYSFDHDDGIDETGENPNKFSSSRSVSQKNSPCHRTKEQRHITEACRQLRDLVERAQTSGLAAAEPLAWSSLEATDNEIEASTDTLLELIGQLKLCIESACDDKMRSRKETDAEAFAS